MRARELRATPTDAERVLWHHLRNRQIGGFKFRRQYPIGPFFADFACIEAWLIIELDGSQHFEPEAIAADQRRTAVLHKHGFTYCDLPTAVLTERDAVLSRVFEWLQAHHPHPNPLPQAGEGEMPRTSP